MTTLMEYRDPGFEVVLWVLALLGMMLYIALLCVALWVVYLLVTLPLRRNERARLFLDILELGMDQGQTPEAAVVSASSSGDSELGGRFHLVAALIAQGQSLGGALAFVPRLLPPEVVSMLCAGERMGDLRLVLAGCRKLLRDAVSQVSGALNYLILVTFVFSPAAVIIPILLKLKIISTYNSVFSDMVQGLLPAFTRLVFGFTEVLVALLVLVVASLWVITLAYIGGPRLRHLLRRVAPWAVDRFFYALPWRRKRLQRDFTQMLSLLLDAGVPEAQAVGLAAEATDNLVIKKRAAAIAEALGRGVSLPTAIEKIDPAGEVRWRLTNALRRGAGFSKALSGWHETLEAQADQQEQAAAQVATTGMVLLNGFVVGATVIAIFLVLVQLIQEATLW